MINRECMDILRDPNTKPCVTSLKKKKNYQDSFMVTIFFKMWGNSLHFKDSFYQINIFEANITKTDSNDILQLL